MKYDWSEMPEHIMWIATDEDGGVYGYIEKPECHVMDVWNVARFAFEYLYTTQPDPNWQDSLEARP